MIVRSHRNYQTIPLNTKYLFIKFEFLRDQLIKLKFQSFVLKKTNYTVICFCPFGFCARSISRLTHTLNTFEVIAAPNLSTRCPVYFAGFKNVINRSNLIHFLFFEPARDPWRPPLSREIFQTSSNRDGDQARSRRSQAISPDAAVFTGPRGIDDLRRQTRVTVVQLKNDIRSAIADSRCRRLRTSLLYVSGKRI